VTLNGTGRALNLATGAIVAGTTFDLIESSGGSSNEGARLNTVSGSFTATTTNIVGPTGTGLDVQSAPAGSSFNFGGTTVNKSASGTGVNLNANGGTIAFSSLAVTTGAGTGVSATSSGTVNVTTGSIAATGGSALVVNPTTIGMTFTTVTSTNSGTTGISLTSASGSLSIGTTTISNPTGVGIAAVSSSATLSFGNTTANGSGGAGVVLGGSGTGNTGTITFGSLNIAPDANQKGLVATDNTNTITATSGAISTSTAIGPTNAAGVEISRSSSATPLAISLGSVSTSGGTNGIFLRNTSGSFTVNGDGTNTSVGGNSTGGTIANMSGADGTTAGIGVYLENVQNITLRRVTINGTNQNFGIRGFRVNNFTLEYSTVNGLQGDSEAFDNYGEGSVMFGDDASVNTNGMTGVGTVTSCLFAGGRARNFSVVNTAGTLNRLTITGSTFGLNGNGNSSSAFEARNSLTVMNVTVTGSTFTGSPGDAANFTGQTGTTMDVIFGGVTATRGTAPGNTITNNHPNNNVGGSNLTFATQGVMNFHCLGNKMSGANGSAVTFFKASAGTSMNGFFNNNEIGLSGTVGSGSLTGNGIFVSAGGTGTMSYTITNNLVHRVNGNFHISADNTGGSYAANFDIRGNTFDTPGATLAGAIGMTNGSPASGDTVNVCAVIGGAGTDKNTISGFAALQQTIFLGSSGANNSATHIFNLPGLPASTETDVQNFVAGNNNMGGSVVDAYVDAPATFAAFKGTGTDCGTPTSAPSKVPADTVSPTADQPTSDQPAEQKDILRAAPGEVSSDGDLHKLDRDGLNWMVQAALARWSEMAISGIDLSRLQAATFEITDLPDGQIASASASHIQIDETAAGYGWFFDQSPSEDNEFQVLVADKELQTTDLSVAHGKMDLLTVVMRALGTVYMQDNSISKATRKNLDPMMDATLSPSVRRLPLDQWKVTLSTNRVGPASGQGSDSRVASTVASQPKAEPTTLVLDLMPAVYNPSTDSKPGSYARTARRVSYAPTASPSAQGKDAPLSGETINKALGTIPPGEKVVIMFSVTVADPFTGATAQVSNQGTVTADGGISVVTNDPDTGAANDATITQINLPDVTVAVAPSSTPEDGAGNLVYTFTRAGSTTGAITVNFSVGGTATPPGGPTPDYSQTGAATFTTTTGTVTIPAGQASADVTIDPTTDTAFEPDETVILTVTTGIGYDVGAPAAATGTIANDDTEVSVAVAPASTPEDGAGNLVYNLHSTGHHYRRVDGELLDRRDGDSSWRRYAGLLADWSGDVCGAHRNGDIHSRQFDGYRDHRSDR
jgi:hypothetical protein